MKLSVSLPDEDVVILDEFVRTAGLSSRSAALQHAIERVFPFQVLLPAAATGLRHDSKARAEQARSIAVERLGAVVGRAPSQAMAQLDDALRLHLQL